MSKDAIRRHAAWLASGRDGPGRLDVADANLTEAQVDGEIPYARFVDCDLSRCRFHLLDLTGVELLRCRLVESYLDGAKLIGARIEDCDATLAYLWITHFTRATLAGGTFREARLARAMFDQTAARGVDLRDANLVDARFRDATFTRCDLRSADLSIGDAPHLIETTRTTFTECDLRGARLHGRMLDGTRFVRCRMDGIIGTPVVAGPVDIIDPDLSAAGDGSGPRDGAELVRRWSTVQR